MVAIRWIWGTDKRIRGVLPQSPKGLDLGIGYRSLSIGLGRARATGSASLVNLG
jgi:hypothetical protein